MILFKSYEKQKDLTTKNSRWNSYHNLWETSELYNLCF